MVAFTKHDLLFILDGITVSEEHASQTNSIVANEWIVSDIETSRQILLSLVPNAFEPIGMRTITGELNNLVDGNENFGAIGEFPRLADATYPDDGSTGNPADAFFMGPGTNTDYSQSAGSASGGNVVDSDPRIISNLIVDQSVRNPAAIEAAGYDVGADGIFGTADDDPGDSVVIDPNGTFGDGDEFFFIENVAPDEGLSAPFNGWMTFFGQFFDHGLDLINKGGAGTIFMPLQPDDPLVTLGRDGIAGTGDEVPAGTPLLLTRATVDPGPDGVLGTGDDVADAFNATSPFVDQNQTYTSHPSHQLFVREYVAGPTGPLSTGHLLEGVAGGMSTWGDVKVQAADLLGIELTDMDGLNIPLFAVDQYGEFIRGDNLLPQFVMSDGSLFEGSLGVGGPISVADAELATGLTVQRTGFSFLLDIAHSANPVDSFGVPLARHQDGNANDGAAGPAGTYDGDLLDAHFIAGDGRANENIALTAVHHVFHQEHNRLVEHTKESLLNTDNIIDLATVGDPTGTQAALDLLNGYLLTPLVAFPPAGTDPNTLDWDGERLFQAARFGTEMQYQHLVFEEFGRKIHPAIDVFGSFETTVDPSIVMEFSQAVYRFGHSMLTEDVDMMDPDGNLTEVGLIAAFLNPVGFNQLVDENGVVAPGNELLMDSSATAGAIVRGMTREVGSEIDEFVTEALRNNLLGLPLDLAAINIARGRDVGVPTLNEARAMFFEGTQIGAGAGDIRLKPYDSWLDFGLNLKHEASIINFIAAYGQHASITGAATLQDKRDAAIDLVMGGGAISDQERAEFLTGTGAWDGIETGINLVDLWIGGLAEAIEPFGGMLGSTFTFVFEDQMERLQDGDRFYYLGRTAGLNFVTQLEQNSFAGMIIRNTDIGDIPGGDHLPGDIFSTPNWILEVDQSRQVTGLDPVDATVAIIESGTVATAQLNSAEWHAVTFTSAIANPVVSMMINTLNGASPVTARVRNVTDNGFEFQLDEYDYSDGLHALETLSWVAVAAGEHTLSDGTIVKAGTTAEDAAGSSNVTFGGSAAFTGAPIVLTQVSTVNEDTAITTRIQDVTAAGFNLRLREQEAGAGPNGAAHATETVGWIAIQQGDGTLLSAGTTGDGITHLTANITHTPGAPIAAPVFLAQMQTRDGNDTSTVRGISFDGNNASLFIEEEQSAGAETNHTGENVGFLALPTGVITGPNPLIGRADPTSNSIFGSLLPLVMRDDPSTAGPDSNYLRYTGGDHVVLGGTEGDDTLHGGIGDDTLWGDGGDDRLEGDDGADIIIGGAGDDIITDIGGPDNLQGGDGNDVIISGAGEDLILAGAGKDYVLMGQDLGETFGGLGDDFIKTGTDENIIFGGEGNDWLEGNGGNNLVQGDNGDPFLNSTVTGHDVFLPGLGDDDYDSESGDDIMVGGIGIQRFEGVNGFDWATYFNETDGVDADMLLRAFVETPIPPGPETIMDRFDQTEGLSGSQHGDILRGSDQDALVIRTLNNGGDGVLRNFDLIQGLRTGDFGGAFDATAIFDAATTEWGEGDIILGGGGSDLIEGRGGDDIIDGDLALGVRILIRDAITDAPIATVDHMQGDLFAVNADGTPQLDGMGARIPTTVTNANGDIFGTLHEAMEGRAINPGDLHIVREILDHGTDDFDTAVFSGNRSEYTVEGAALPNGFGDVDGDGFVTVTNDLGGPDGTDLLRNIERLQFSDLSLQIPGLNNAPTGAPEIVLPGTMTPATNPAVGQQLEASLGTLADADGLPVLPGHFSYRWQFEEEPGSGAFVDFEITNASGEVGPLTGQLITVPELALGAALRVVVSYQDGGGVIETVASAPTEIVGNAVAPNGTPEDDILIGTPFADTINGFAGNDQIFGLGDDDMLNGGADDDLIEGGGGDDTINGGGGLDELFGGAGMDTLNGGGAADFLDGGGDDDTLNGNGGADEILGGAGNDTIDGGNGADEIFGGADDDTIDGGNGNDTIIWNVGDGRDLIDGGDNGGAGDAVEVFGDGAISETFRVVAVTDNLNPAVAAFIAGFGPFDPATEVVVTRNGGGGEEVIAELDNIEELVINDDGVPAGGGGVGGDTVLVLGDFSGTSLALETITINGTSGDDTVDITGLASAHRIVFRSNGGNDTIIGELRPQDVVELAPGLTRDDYDDPVFDPSTGLWTISQTGGGHSITYPGDASSAAPTFAADSSTPGPEFDFTIADLRELKNLVRGEPSDNAEDHATGIRDLEGTDNNETNPDFGAADQPFIRLTDPRYGPDDGAGNRHVNPMFDGLNPRTISNILGDQEDGLPKNSEDGNIFFMAFGQYLDHGLDFLPKGGSGVIGIGSPGDDPANLTRGSVDSMVDGIPQHLNKTSPFADQNQAYGSTELVGQFLRQGDGNGGLGARLFAGAPDPSNPEFNLLPTLRELILHHWENDTVFEDQNVLPGPVGPISFRDYFTGLDYEVYDQHGNVVATPNGDLVTELPDGTLEINEEMVPFMNQDFMNSGHTLVGDANPFISLLDHYVAGDLRANENYTLTAMHTVWARNHNFHVDKLATAGFDGTAEELFQAAKLVNEVEYQRVVFDEFADKLLGGLKGSGEHGHDEYDPNVDARISHEFAAAAYRFGHSLIAQTISVRDADGSLKQVPLTDVFLNPTNDDEAFIGMLPPGYEPQPGYEQHGINPILDGIANQAAEEVDPNLVDAIRNDLVRIRADLFSFNAARGRDVGLGSMNQIRMDLMKSDSPYIQEAIELSGEDLSPYRSWEDFRARNALSAAVLAQFIAAYPDLVLGSQSEIDAFKAANPDIELVNGNTVKGVDRMELWPAGLAEAHINGGMVGVTFWVVLHEQFDRLQQGDRLYYLDRAGDFDFYENFVEEQSFSDIVARNTGLEGLPDDIFSFDGDDANDGDDQGDGDGQDDGDGQNDGDSDGGSGDGTTDGPLKLIGDDEANTLVGMSGDDIIVGNGEADTLIAGGGNDTVSGGDGADEIIGGDGNDILLGGDGDDDLIDLLGDNIVLAGAGRDRVMTGDGDDTIDGGADRDVVDAGGGNDTILASFDDGDDVYNGGDGIDTLDFSAITSGVTVDLGNGMFGTADSDQSGTDSISGFENVIGGAGNDTITANSSVNVMAGLQGLDTFEFNMAGDADGDHITDFQTGDTIDLSGMAVHYGFSNFNILSSGTTFSGAGELIITMDGADAIVEGNVEGDDQADFSIRVSGKTNLDGSDFDGV